MFSVQWEGEVMETQYEVIARHRKLHSETYVITHRLETEAVEWVLLDSKHCGHLYGYQIMTLRKPDDDRWHRVSCRYWLDGAEVTEEDYLKNMNCDKSHTIKA